MIKSDFPDPPSDKADLEDSTAFTPRFGSDGLIAAVVTEQGSGELLMLGHMNAEALALSLQSGTAHFWSRSRKKLWKKGETSGNYFSISEIRTDCDQDAIWLKVSVAGDGVACHTGRKSCFYRIVGSGTQWKLQHIEGRENK